MIIYAKMGSDGFQIHLYLHMAFFGFKTVVEMSILNTYHLSTHLSTCKRAAEGLEHLPEN